MDASTSAARGKRPKVTVMANVYSRWATRRCSRRAWTGPAGAASRKSEDDALGALADYGTRYAPIAAAAGYTFPAAPASRSSNACPAPPPPSSASPRPPRPRRPTRDGRRRPRHTKLLTAAWAAFDGSAATAPPSLRKGPRGGGRDRDKMIDHVIGAEAAYARKIGVKLRQPAIDDTAAIAALHDEVLAVLGRPHDGGPLVDNGWTARYAARRYRLARPRTTCGRCRTAPIGAPGQPRRPRSSSAVRVSIASSSGRRGSGAVRCA